MVFSLIIAIAAVAAAIVVFALLFRRKRLFPGPAPAAVIGNILQIDPKKLHKQLEQVQWHLNQRDSMLARHKIFRLSPFHCIIIRRPLVLQQLQYFEARNRCDIYKITIREPRARSSLRVAFPGRIFTW